MSIPAENTLAGLARATKTASSPSENRHRTDLARFGRHLIDHRLENRDNLVRRQIGGRKRQDAGSEREQAPVAVDEAAPLKGEQDAPRRRPGETGGFRDFAQAHRLAPGPENLQRAQPAVEALDIFRSSGRFALGRYGGVLLCD